MDSGLVKRGLDFTRRKRRWITLLGLFGFSTYGVYKVYHMPSIARKRRTIFKIFGSLVSMSEMVSHSAETITLVSRDLKEFLEADTDEIPHSLKQLSKLAQSESFSKSVVCFCEAMTIGASRGYKVENNRRIEIPEVDSLSFSDRIMNKLMSSAGMGFVSVIVGSFARNLVLGFYANGCSSAGGQSGSSHDKPTSSNLPTWVSVMSDDKCRVLVADCIKTFVSNAVAVYLDKTMDVNFYDEMFSGLTNPKHQNIAIDILVSLCNGAVETLVKTSHQVLTASKSKVPYSVTDKIEASKLGNKKDFEPEARSRKDANGNVDFWVSSVMSTLAVPRNRKFLVDVTGRVTFETVRSVIDFLRWKMSEGLKKSVNMVHDEVVGKGFEIVRYVGYKSSVILTICIALFLHVLGNIREVLPA
ncbi:hypothetical protein OROMI_013470 [Orobanche minor]